MVSLDSETVPLVLPGPRRGPDKASIELARSVASSIAAYRQAIAEAMFEHYQPYARASVAEAPGSEPTTIQVNEPADIWSYTEPVFFQITLLEGQPIAEIGYEVAWDEEHTLGARLRAGQFVELCGSVIAP
jgi:hypothetical protein